MRVHAARVVVPRVVDAAQDGREVRGEEVVHDGDVLRLGGDLDLARELLGVGVGVGVDVCSPATTTDDSVFTFTFSSPPGAGFAASASAILGCASGASVVFAFTFLGPSGSSPSFCARIASSSFGNR
jgi:hypothetical protein